MQQEQLHFQVVTAAGTAVDEMTRYVSLPLVGGSVGILPGHAPLLAAVAAGMAICDDGVDRKTFQVSDGIVEVSDNHVLVLSQPV